MNDNIFSQLKHELKLEYTYKLTRGKLPEKIYLQKDRYTIINFNQYKSHMFYKEINGTYYCGIYDNINNTYLKIYTRNGINNNIIEKSINLYTLDNTVIKQIYYIPLCVKLLGDPNNLRSISIDHIDINNMNDSINNLRWASCSEQNTNKTRKETIDEYDDWIYEYESKSYNSIDLLYKYLKNINTKINNITANRFRDQLQKSCKRGKLTYGLEIKRKIIELNDKGKEEWKELDPNLKLKQFKFISNYGRFGRKYNNLIIPRTMATDKVGYKRIKLKYLNTCIGVHYLVYKHFIGPIPDGYIVDHIDENKNNNHVSNLQIMTQSENISKTMVTNKDHKSTVNIIFENIKTKELLEFNTKRACADYLNISINVLNYKIKTTFNNIIIVNGIDYNITQTYKKDFHNKDVLSPKLVMKDKFGNIIKRFYSFKEVYRYYKQNGYTFSPETFKSKLNKNLEYNIPNIIWESV